MTGTGRYQKVWADAWLTVASGFIVFGAIAWFRHEEGDVPPAAVGMIAGLFIGVLAGVFGSIRVALKGH